MGTSPRMRWPYPNEGSDPWYDTFEALVTASDTSAFAAFEDRNLAVSGGGNFTFSASTGILSWADDVVVNSPMSGVPQTLEGPGSSLLLDGQFAYVALVRGNTQNTPLTISVAYNLPSNTYDSALVLFQRIGPRVYFRNGAILQDGSTAAVFETNGGGGGGGGVTSVTAGIGLSGGTITTSGIIDVVYGSSANTACEGDDHRLTNARPPTGSAGGALAGTYPNPSIAASGVAAGAYSSPNITISADGRITSATNVGVVTGVGTSAPLSSTGGSTPVISHDTSGVSAGTYSYPYNLSVSDKGHITALSSGSAPVTLVTASSPLSSTGGATPDISLTGTVAPANGGTGGNSSASTGIAHVVLGNWSYSAVNIGSGSTEITGTLPVANGGTGLSSLAANAVLLGGATVSTVSPGGSGNVLTSNGTTWTSAAPTGGAVAFKKNSTTIGTTNAVNFIAAGYLPAALVGGVPTYTVLAGAASKAVNTTPYTITASSVERLYASTGALTGNSSIVLPLSTDVEDQLFFFYNFSGYTVTLNPTGGETIGNSVSYSLADNESVIVYAGPGFWILFGVGGGASTFTPQRQGSAYNVTTTALSPLYQVVGAFPFNGSDYAGRTVDFDVLGYTNSGSVTMTVELWDLILATMVTSVTVSGTATTPASSAAISASADTTYEIRASITTGSPGDSGTVQYAGFRIY